MVLHNWFPSGSKIFYVDGLFAAYDMMGAGVWDN